MSYSKASHQGSGQPAIFQPILLVLILIFITFPRTALAQLQRINNATCSQLGIRCTGSESEANIVAVINLLLDAGLILVVSIAAIFFLYAGYKYITSRGSEEEAATAKRQITYGVIGLIIAASAYLIRDAIVFNGQLVLYTGDIETLRLIPLVNFLSVFIGIVATIFFIYGGFKYITSAGQEDEAATAKRQILYGIIGIIIASTANTIAGIFVAGGLFRPPELGARSYVETFIVPALNAFLVFAGVAATAYIILSGIMYFSSQGDEQRSESAKRQLIYGLIGISIIILSSVIIRFVAVAIGVGFTS